MVLDKSLHLGHEELLSYNIRPLGQARDSFSSCRGGKKVDWRSRLSSKLVSLEQAVARVQSGNTVGCSPYTTSPVTLAEGLKTRARRGEIENVRIEHLASLVSWTDSDLGAYLAQIWI